MNITEQKETLEERIEKLENVVKDLLNVLIDRDEDTRDSSISDIVYHNSFYPERCNKSYEERYKIDKE